MNRVVNQRYTLLRVLGRGGSGEVFLAADRERPGARVALKYLAETSGPDAERLREEFRRMSRLQHPGLVQVFDLQTDRERGEPFIVMEHVEGEDFASACRGIPLGTLVDLVQQACLALEYLHAQGIVHRDLKPENLLVSPAGAPQERPRARILDFGLSAESAPANAAKAGGHLAGTIAYMAPEQFRGEWVDHRADRYALGVLVYQALAGRLPFEAADPAALVRAHLEEEPPPPSARRPGMDPALEAIVLRLLRKRPAERYQSARQVMEALQRFAAASGGAEAAPPLHARAARLVGRRRQLAAIDHLTASILEPDPPPTPPRLFVHGPAGSGKTRLAEEARTVARSRGLEVVWLARSRSGWGPFDLQRRLSLALEEGPGALCGATCAADGPPAAPSEEPAAILRRLVTAVSGVSPLLMIVEDLDAADPDSLRTLGELLRLGEGVRAAVLATARRPLEELSPPLAADWLHEGAGSEEPLEALSDAEISALLASLMGAEPGSTAPVPLLERTAGNPLFAQEWALTLAERGTLGIRQGAWWIDEAALLSLPAPPGLVDLCRLRLDGVSPPARQLLAALAALERPSPLADAVAVGDLDGDAAQGAVEESRRHGLLRTPEGADGASALELAHATLREAARELAGPGFAALQRRAAALLETSGAAPAADLARRWREVGDAPRMKSHALRAADEAAAAGAWEQEVRLLEWALEAVPAGASAERLKIARRLAMIPYTLVQKPLARRYLARYREAAVEAGDDRSALDALIKEHACCINPSDNAALARLEPAIREGLSTVPDPALEALFERSLSLRASAEGDPERAVEHARRAGELYRSAGDPVKAALCLNNAGVYVQWVREPGVAERIFVEAEALLVEAGASDRLWLPRLNLALAAAQRGRFEDAEKIHAEHFETLRATGHVNAAASVCLNLAHVRERLGALDRALEGYEQAAEMAERHGLTTIRLYALERHGSLLRLLGLHERAEQIHARALALAQRLQLPLQIAFISAALAEDACAAGDAPRAAALAAEAVAHSERLNHARARQRAALAAAQADLAAGRLSEAEACLATARSLTDFTHQHLESARLLALAARTALARGERGAAGEALAGGLEHARLGALLAEEAELLALALENDLADGAAAHEKRLQEVLEAMTRGVSDPAVARMARFAPAWRSAAEKLAARPAPSAADEGTGRLADRQALQALAEIGRIIETLEDPHRLAGSLLERARALIGADRALLVLTDPDGKNARTAASSDLPAEAEPEALAFSSAALSRGLEGPLLILEAGGDPRLASSSSVERFGIRSVVCSPLRLRGTLLGAVYLDSRHRVLPIGEDHLRFLEAFAHQMAAGLDAARALEALRSERERLRSRALERYRFHSLLGRSPAMQKIYDLLEPFSKSDLPVMVTGESGTGKELVARALHWNGPRREGPFVAESCAAIPENLLESEMFGHLRGAFTGAERDRRGVFVEASGGTLFLDEIAEMSPGLQAKLLRALQEKEVRPLGAGRAIGIDVRVVAATHRDLPAAVRAGTFREDLLYRLRVLTLHLPALRERLEDLPLLARHFLAEQQRESGRGPLDLSPEVLERLARHPWPGNVRELRGEVLKLALVAEGTRVERRDIESHPELFGSLLRPGRQGIRQRPGTLRDLERRQVERALRAARGDKQKAATLLGLSRATLYRKLRRYRISLPPAH